MNPNKHKPTRWKDLELCKNCGDKEFGPDVVDRKTGLCAECLVGALERENKEQATCIKMVTEANRKWEASYHEWKARAEKAEKELAIAQDTCGKACRGERRTYLEKEQAELRTEEAELEALVAKDQLGVHFFRANELEAKLQLEADATDALHRIIEGLEAKLAGYERRPNCETCAVSDCPTCGQQGLPFCSKYKPNRKQREHFPDKKEADK